MSAEVESEGAVSVRAVSVRAVSVRAVSAEVEGEVAAGVLTGEVGG